MCDNPMLVNARKKSIQWHVDVAFVLLKWSISPRSDGSISISMQITQETVESVILCGPKFDFMGRLSMLNHMLARQTTKFDSMCT